MFDLKITGGTIVDGTGADSFVGDVGITDGQIVAVSHGPLEGDATETIDATGKIVTPGFVDIHSHYDGQAFFDQSLSPSTGHGVTTIVMGVCGIGFAPARAEDHELLVEVMESVEDIPGDVLRAGLPWTWESFPEFLDALDTNTYAADIAAHIGHVPVRTYVMGEKALENGPATEGEIAQMAHHRPRGHRGRSGGLLELARRRPHHRPGASRCPAPTPPRTSCSASPPPWPRPVRSPCSSWPRRAPTARTPKPPSRRSTGCVGCPSSSALPMSFLVLQAQAAPDVWRELMDASTAAEADGAVLRPQIANRPFGMLLGLRTRHPFVKRPTFHRLAEESTSFEELVARLGEPEVKAAILAEEDTIDTGMPMESLGLIATYMPHLAFPVGEEPDYEPPASDSVAARAEAEGRRPPRGVLRPHAALRGRSALPDPLLQLRQRQPGRHLRHAHPPGRPHRAGRRRGPTWPRSATPPCPPTSSATG